MKKSPSTSRAAQTGGKATVQSQEPALPGQPENLILLPRGEKVILDAHLAALYEVTTGNLNKAVKRHLDRFPGDFMFQLTQEEYRSLRFQFGILERGRHAKYLPYAFTEQGVAMLSSVLNSERAVKVNIEVMRAFVRMRRVLEAHRTLTKKLSELETTVGTHDEEIRLILETLRQLMQTPPKPKLPIGFGVKERKGRYAVPRKKAIP